MRYWMKWIAGFLCVALTFSNTLSVGVQVNAAEIETGILDENENPDEENTEEITDDIIGKENEEEIEQREEEAEEPEENTVDTNDTEEKENGKEKDEREGEKNIIEDETKEPEKGQEDADVVEEGEEKNNADDLVDEEAENQELVTSPDVIASGVIDEDYGYIVWKVDAEGKLTVEGTGDFSEPGYYNSLGRAPWHSDTILTSITSAEIDITGLTDASYMFSECQNLKSVDLSNLKTKSVTDMRYMFAGCKSLENVDLTSLDTRNVKDMAGMFYSCSSLDNIDLSRFETGNVTYMDYMFYYSGLTNIDLSGFDTRNVVDMAGMFGYSNSLTKIDLSGLDTRNVVNMRDMFLNCSSLESINLSMLNTENVTDMSGMFCRCSSLTSINLIGLDTGNVTNMQNMFSDCNSLESVDISGFNTKNVKNMYEMFWSCNNLTSINLGNFNTRSVVNAVYMIEGCDNLTTIHTPYNLSVSAWLPRQRGDTWYKSDGTEVTELPQNLSYSIELGKNYIPKEGDTEIDMDEETINKIEITSNVSLSKDKSGVQIIDGKTGEPISGARVWVDREYWTGDNGIAELSNTGLTTIQVEKEGYHNKKAKKRLEKGKVMVIVLCPDNGDIQILSASLNLTGEDEDVLDETVCLTHNDLSKVNGIDATFTLKVESSGKAEKYQLIQNGKILQENSTGIFELAGKYVNKGNGILSYYVDGLLAGYKVSVRVYGTEENRAGGNGNSGFGTKKVSRIRSLGIRVSEESFVALKLNGLDSDGKMEFGDKLTVTVPESIPLLGGSELKFGFEEKLPYTIKIENSGSSNKVRIAVNLKEDSLDSDEGWKKMKEKYDNLAKKALRASGAGKAFGANPESFDAAMVSLKGSVVGYGEGYLDDSRDSLCVNVGFIIEVKGDAKRTNYYFIAYIPFYVTYGVGTSLTASGEIKLAYDNDYGLRCNGGSLELEPTIYGVLEGGMGADGVLSVGAYGGLTFSYLHRFIDNYSRIKINGNIKIKATALVWSKVLAEADFLNLTLDESNKRSAAYNARTGTANMDWQNMSGAELISMAYLTKRSENPGISTFSLNRSGNSGSTRFMSYAYENASPQLLKVGGKLYLFYLDGVEGRSAQNQTALFYQSSADNGVTWTNAVRVDSKANETADYDFDVAVSGNNIYVLWSDAGEIYGDEILSMDSEKAIATVGQELDLMLAVINSSTGAIKTSSIATDVADMKPHLAVGNDGTVYAAWITNDASSAKGLLSSENQMGICYASSADNYTVHSIPLTKGYYPLTLDVGTVGTQICIATDIDVDGNLNTQEDREIYIVNLKEGKSLDLQASNDVADSVPVFGEIAGNSCLFWYQGGNIAYTLDRQNTSFVFEDNSIPPMGQEFSLMEGSNGNASIVWTATSQAEDVGVDMYCTDFDGSGWSNAYMLDKMESEYTAPVSGYLDGADYRMAYLGSTYEGDELYSHIYLCTPQKRTDTSVTLSAEGDGIQGEEYPLHLTVANNGNAPVNSLTISSADGSIQETIAGLSIAPGALYDFTWSGITLPSEMSEVYTCKLTVKVPGETDIDGNVFDLTVGEPDFSIDTYLDYSNGDQFAGVIVSNNGILPSDVVLTVYKDENHTSQVYQTTLSGIKGGESKLAIFDLTALDKKSPAFYFAVTDVNGKEIYIGDNEAVLYAGKGTYLEGDSSGDDNDKPTPSPTVEPTAKPTAAPTAKPTAQPATPTPGRPVPSDFPFRDVAVVPGNWKYESIKYVYENGVMNGITNPDGTIDSFQPDESLTRAMFAAVLYRMAGQPPVEFENRFSDVSTGRYYSSAIIWAYKNGIVNGYADGNYGVDDFITREQIAKMLRVYAQVRGYSTNDRADLSRFPDISEVSGWAMEHISWAVGCGMINGKNINGTYYLDAKGNATRAECAAMLMRFINRYGK